MKFLLDESADFPLAARLKELGHHVTAIAHDCPQAIKDRDVLDIAHQGQRILITAISVNSSSGNACPTRSHPFPTRSRGPGDQDCLARIRPHSLL